MITIIVACATNGVIGNKNTIPWQIPEDTKLFKEATKGAVVIMGRNTWDSIPEKFKPLSNRFNIIISSKGPDHFKQYLDNSNFLVTNSLKNAIEVANLLKKEIFIIGGASVYKEAMNNQLVDRLLISHIDGEFEGDTYFEFIPTEWNAISEVPYQGFKLVTYTRK